MISAGMRDASSSKEYPPQVAYTVSAHEVKRLPPQRSSVIHPSHTTGHASSSDHCECVFEAGMDFGEGWTDL